MSGHTDSPPSEHDQLRELGIMYRELSDRHSRLRLGVLQAIDAEDAFAGGGHGGMVPTDEEIIGWVAEERKKMLNVYEAHHDVGMGRHSFCSKCGMWVR